MTGRKRIKRFRRDDELIATEIIVRALKKKVKREKKGNEANWIVSDVR